MRRLKGRWALSAKSLKFGPGTRDDPPMDSRRLTAHIQETGSRRSVAQRRIGTVPMTEESAPRLLVVDDEPNIRELLSVSLRFSGFEVVAAASGRDATTSTPENRRLTESSSRMFG